MSMRGRARGVLVGVSAVLLIGGVFLLLVYVGVIRFNHPSRTEYPVRGVDVSEYQGAINWNVLSGEGISFAFIKATEGSSYVDPRFSENWAGAQESGLRVGAYHFFSFDSPGSTQAENFLAQVPSGERDLPPVVDLELYGAYKRNPKSADAVWAELQVMLDALSQAYQTKPVLYVTGKSYALYLEGRDVDCDIWIRSVYLEPGMEDWTFWQYTDKAVLDGYAGEEKYIDLNVFSGSESDFTQY